MFGTDRTQLREHFVNVWEKHRNRVPMDPMDRLIASVIQLHPEYHKILESPETMLNQDFDPEDGHTNPFLHMGMHIGLEEQIGADRPAGIAVLYRSLTEKTGDPHESEHRMMECLGQVLWEAQRNNRLPDEEAYLECLRTCINTG